MFSTTTLVSLEGFSYIAQLISGLSIFLLLIQIKISTNDIKIRSTREAGLLSMQQAEKFANEILPEEMEIRESFKQQGVFLERKKIFQFSELKVEMTKSKNLFQKIEILNKDKDLSNKVSRYFNRIEAMAMIFISGVGDESMVFASLAKPFCSIIENYYFVIAMSRKEDILEGYPSIMKLYKIWSSRMEKNKLDKEIKKLTTDFKGIQVDKVSPIGS